MWCFPYIHLYGFVVAHHNINTDHHTDTYTVFFIYLKWVGDILL